MWIALAVDISKSSYCRVSPGGGHSHIRPCQTIYTAFAFVLFEWVLFTVTFSGAIYGYLSDGPGSCPAPSLTAFTSQSPTNNNKEESNPA
jgi:hypothetical protein